MNSLNCLTAVELADILSVKIMLDYILSDDDFIKSSFLLIGEILGDKTYLRIDEKLIALEDTFYTRIAFDKRHFKRIISKS